MLELSILHEYGAPQHFMPHRLLEQQGRLSLDDHVGHVGRRVAKGLLRRDRGLVRDGLADGRAFLELLAQAPRSVVVGYAPYSEAVYYLRLLRRRHRLVYFTSWPHWGPDQGVHHGSSRVLRAGWLKLLRQLDVVSVTAAGARALAELGARTTVIPHAVDVRTFRAERTTDQVRPLEALFVGRLVPEKGIELLIRCVKRMAALPLRWRFVGEGPLRDAVLDLQRAGLPVEAPGAHGPEALRADYQSADFLVLPSYSVPKWEELFGIVVIEGFAAGLPAIVTDCVGPREIVEDHVTGLIVEQRSEARLEDAIRTLVSDRGLLRSLGAAARARAERTYDLPVVAERWAEVLGV